MHRSAEHEQLRHLEPAATRAKQALIGFGKITHPLRTWVWLFDAEFNSCLTGFEFGLMDEVFGSGYEVSRWTAR